MGEKRDGGTRWAEQTDREDQAGEAHWHRSSLQRPGVQTIYSARGIQLATPSAQAGEGRTVQDGVPGRGGRLGQHCAKGQNPSPGGSSTPRGRLLRPQALA